MANLGPRDVDGENGTLLLRPISSFVVVGTLGFLVDSAILSWLVHAWGWSPYTARVLSFVPAVTVTWYCNRRWVFARTNNAAREYGTYFAFQTLGAAINFGTYALLIAAIPALGLLPVVPLVAGSALALLFNYTAAKRWVFGER